MVFSIVLLLVNNVLLLYLFSSLCEDLLLISKLVRLFNVSGINILFRLEVLLLFFFVVCLSIDCNCCIKLFIIFINKVE